MLFFKGEGWQKKQCPGNDIFFWIYYFEGEGWQKQCPGNDIYFFVLYIFCCQRDPTELGIR